ncbi:MAG: hypothetical protein FJX76_23880 [Armatimonadetes bacterium]|nr:hypothetical protein [Armatimonadota bacterium]
MPRRSETPGEGDFGLTRPELEADCKTLDGISPKTKALLANSLRAYQRKLERAGRRVPARLFSLLKTMDVAEKQNLPLKDVGERLGVRPELLLSAIKRGRLYGFKTPVDHPPGHVWCTTVQEARKYMAEVQEWRREGMHKTKRYTTPSE